MFFPEYDAIDATALAELIAKGEISSEEVLEAAIERIEERNPRLNAVVRKMYDEAWRLLRQGIPDGPLRGVPFLLKDLSCHYAGTPTGCGSRLFQRIRARRHSTLTRRYLGAGLVIVGKTNTPELGLSGTTEPEANGPTRNPWDLARSPGGSSGGSAAAVAARLVPMAHGTDTGGSIRNPASNCGLFGLKPSRGRIPSGPGVLDPDNGLSVMHALTRSVRDSARLLDATTGPAPGELYRAPPSLRPFTDEIGKDPGRLKIAFHSEAHHDCTVHPECVKALEKAVRLCEDLGHVVEPARPSLDGQAAIRFSRILWSVNVAASVTQAYKTLNRPADGSDLEWITWELAKEGRNTSALVYHNAVQAMHQVSIRLASFFERYDLVLSPVVSRPPWPLDQYERSYTDTHSYVSTVFDYSPFCWPYNVSGQPAMAVPMHWTSDGLPVGVMFAAHYGDEATLFRLASQLEQANPWCHRVAAF